MTASSPRGTFSQAELTEVRVITRCITRPISPPGVTIRAMPGDLEPLPVRVLRAAGPAVLAAELLARIRAELPMIGELGEPGAAARVCVADRAALGAHLCMPSFRP